MGLEDMNTLVPYNLQQNKFFSINDDEVTSPLLLCFQEILGLPIRKSTSNGI